MNVRLKRARELAGYAVQLTKDEGLGTMLARGAGFVRRRCFGKKARYLPAKKVLEAQRAEMAGKNFENCQLSTISVLTPLYNTPEVFLRQFLDSFVNQTAPNGELCLADASDAAHSSVGDIVREYQAKYQHIVYKKIENKGIAANTNAAAELASGEYLALADHDDILAPHAMYTMGRAIRQLREAGEPDGFLYSDEALFTKKIEKPLVAHFKPDYAPDYLLCCNYICHLAVFRRELFEQVGGERPECDGSQDHDLFLRLIERVGGAAHVPQVLYYWRVHEGSTSGGTDAKPYVAKAAKKALADHLERTGRTGTIEDGLYPSTYRVRWDIVGEPKVSILIPNKDHTEDLEKCLQSIWKKTTWDRFEVIVIENNSTDPATFAYYEKARQRYDGLKVVTYPGKGFNFSAINNFGRKVAEGDYLLLLNNDVEVVNGDWLTEDDFTAALASYQAASAIPLFIGSDEEGGTVTRASKNPNLFSEPLPSPQELYAAGGLDGLLERTLSYNQKLKAFGVNVNFAPVCDVSTNPDNFIYARSFGQDAQTTADYISSVVPVYAQSGVACVLKHFPGYGNNADTHTGIALDARPYTTFEKSDLVPFESGIAAGAPFVLVSHNIVECMDGAYPASLSAKVHTLLRDTLGFTGVIVTDDLAMDAVKAYAQDGSAAVLAIQAGNDMIVTTDYQTQIPQVIAAVQSGEIAESDIDAHVFRVLHEKQALGLID